MNVCSFDVLKTPVIVNEAKSQVIQTSTRVVMFNVYLLGHCKYIAKKLFVWLIDTEQIRYE